MTTFVFSNESDPGSNQINVMAAYLDLTEGITDHKAKKMIALGLATSVMTRVVEETCGEQGLSIMHVPTLGAYAYSIHSAAVKIVDLTDVETDLSDEAINDMLTKFSEGK